MRKGSMSLLAGAAAGVLAGMAVGAVGSRMMGMSKKAAKKSAGKAVRAVGDFVESVQYMMR